MFEGETAALQNWLLQRLHWMDAALAKQADPSAGWCKQQSDNVELCPFYQFVSLPSTPE
jgi:hypothetical protein